MLPSNEAELQLFPNPTNGFVNITIKPSDIGSRLSIYSARGDLVVNTILRSERNVVDLGHLSKGLYVVSFVDKREKLMVD
jgi:hypothetical protein